MTWFTSTLLATLAYGAMQGLQNVAAHRSLSLRRILLSSAVVVAVLAVAAGLLTGSLHGGAKLFGLSALSALLFTTASFLVLAAMRRAPAAIVLPANRLDALLVVVIGAVAFGERPAAVQWAGAALGLGVVALLSFPPHGASRRDPEAGRSLAGLAMAVASAVCFAGATTVAKIASTAAPRLSFVAVSYAFTSALSLGALRLWKDPDPGPPRERASLGYGAAIGVLNFIGYLALLEAFATGPLALIQPIFATSMLIAVWISRRAIGERVSLRQAAALVLSVAAALLIRLGG